MKPLHKTTIVVWSEWETSVVDIEDLCHEAIQGDAYCSSVERTVVADPEHDPTWDGTEFFADEEGS